MSFITDFESQLSDELLELFHSLDTPYAIQTYLDSFPYIAEERDRSPLNVLRDRQAHCLDGGLFGALALWRIGYKPLIMDIVPDPGMEDDHVLALYKEEGCWGAVAKSNYVNLGFRDAVYKSYRELVMTYFEHYCSFDQSKALRGYARPLDVSKYIHLNWAVDEIGANILYHKHFYKRKTISIISKKSVTKLNHLSDRAYQAETLFTDLNWSYGIRPAH